MDLAKSVGIFKNIAKRTWPNVENAYIELHSKVLAVTLGILSLALGGQQLLGGDNIRCIGPGHEEQANLYCYYNAYVYKNPSTVFENPYPHTFHGKHASSGVFEVGGMRWISIYLFLHCAITLIPSYLWRRMENGTVKCMLLGDEPKLMGNLEWTSKRAKIISYITYRFRRNQSYGTGLVVAEILSLVFSILNYKIVEWYLRYPLYGLLATDIIEPEGAIPGNNHANSVVFPQLAKCKMPVVGPGGSMVNTDYVCVMELSFSLAKVYIVVWFLFTAVIGFSFVWMVFRCLTVFFPCLRTRMLKQLCSRSKFHRVKAIVRKGGFRDYVLLCLLGKNMLDEHFEDLINNLRIDAIKNV